MPVPVSQQLVSPAADTSRCCEPRLISSARSVFPTRPDYARTRRVGRPIILFVVDAKHLAQDFLPERQARHNRCDTQSSSYNRLAANRTPLLRQAP